MPTNRRRSVASSRSYDRWLAKQQGSHKKKKKRTKQQKLKDKEAKHQQRHPVIPYSEYLRTRWWRVKRAQKLRSKDHQCERCGKEAVQVHHKHYKTLWREKNTDLVAICRDCHEKEHEILVQCDARLRSIQRQV